MGGVYNTPLWGLSRVPNQNLSTIIKDRFVDRHCPVLRCTMTLDHVAVTPVAACERTRTAGSAPITRRSRGIGRQNRPPTATPNR